MRRQQQLVHVGTGEGTNGWIPHTYGIIERYLPAQVKAMRAAHQQHWDINFAAINWIHVPVALALDAVARRDRPERRYGDDALTTSNCSQRRFASRCSATPLSAA